MKNNRQFLKRTKAEGLSLENMYIGSTVDFFSRQLNFVDYGDDFTRRKLSCKKERYSNCSKTSYTFLFQFSTKCWFISGLKFTKYLSEWLTPKKHSDQDCPVCLDLFGRQLMFELLKHLL